MSSPAMSSSNPPLPVGSSGVLPPTASEAATSRADAMDFAQAVTWLQNQSDASDNKNLGMCKTLMNQFQNPAATKDMWTRNSALLKGWGVQRCKNRKDRPLEDIKTDFRQALVKKVAALIAQTQAEAAPPRMPPASSSSASSSNVTPLAAEPSRPIIVAAGTQTQEFADAVKWLNDELRVTANANLQTCSALANKLTDPAATKQTWHSRTLLKEWGVERLYKTIGREWQNRPIEDIKRDLCQSLLRRIKHMRMHRRSERQASAGQQDETIIPGEDEAFIAELKKRKRC